jgi:hypothetical protein
VFVGNGRRSDWLTGTKITASLDGTSTRSCAPPRDRGAVDQAGRAGVRPGEGPDRPARLVVNGKAQVALADGSVRNLSKLPSKETLKALITRSGGEVPVDF